MGHSPKMLLDTYGHKVDEASRELARAMGGAVGNALGLEATDDDRLRSV
jgi:hypothetical protein